jgi:hypothetical protein
MSIKRKIALFTNPEGSSYSVKWFTDDSFVNSKKFTNYKDAEEFMNSIKGT